MRFCWPRSLDPSPAEALVWFLSGRRYRVTLRVLKWDIRLRLQRLFRRSRRWHARWEYHRRGPKSSCGWQRKAFCEAAVRGRSARR